MTGKKVKLAFIANDSARKVTYRKRKNSIIKQVSELSTLCGVDACAIVYSPYESQPEVWPNTEGVQNMLTRFERVPEVERSKKMENQESLLRQRIAKVNEKLKKQLRDNHEMEMNELMYQCINGDGLQKLSMPDLSNLRGFVDQKLDAVYKRIAALEKMNASCPPQVAPPPPSNFARNGNEMMTSALGHGQEHTLTGDGIQGPNDHLGFTQAGDHGMVPFGDQNQLAMW